MDTIGLLPSDIVENGWTQGVFAQDENQWHVEYGSPDAVCFCASGAILRAEHDGTLFAIQCDNLRERIEKEIHIERDEFGFIKFSSITLWNDFFARTKEEVINLLRCNETGLGLR